MLPQLSHLRAQAVIRRTRIKTLRTAGAIPPVSTLPKIIPLLRGSGKAAQMSVLAEIHGNRPAVIDAKGTLSYQELAKAVNAVANGFDSLLPENGQPIIGLMCRNSRYLLISLQAATAIGAKLVLLNTDLNEKQLAEICQRENVTIVIADSEFSQLFTEIDSSVLRFTSWFDDEFPRATGLTLDDLIANSSSELPPKPKYTGALVILTSGSTGTPKGALRKGGQGALVAGILEKIPVRKTDRIFLAPPAYHGWGLVIVGTALAVGACLVFDRRFNAQRTVEIVSENRCTAIIAVPTMLKRLMDLPRAELDRIDHNAIRIIGTGGGKLDPTLAVALLTEFGPTLHNLYGATEAAFITIATPDDLLAEPGSVGRPPAGVEVAIVKDGAYAPTGEVGEIHIRSASAMKQYTNGENKEHFAGMMKTGDTGRLDVAGRLFVEGRSDGMIVSGGENVFPEEVENALLYHPDIDDAKVIPVDDVEFGQRLRAFIVTTSGNPLTAEEVKSFITQNLSRSRVPRDLIFVPDLNRSASGKVTQKTLDQLAETYAAAPPKSK